MIHLVLAALLAAAAPSDTVYTVDGGRVVGTVLEESPSSGVSIQAPDGTVRRIPAGQVARIEFSDGTVSEARPPPAAAVAAPAPPPHQAGPSDAVFFTGGGRVRGTVIQEDPKTGVKLRLLDGSLRTYGPEEFTRIEYADGTVSRRKPVEPAPVPPAPAARALPAEGAFDTVYFAAGGRVRGTVIEEHPVTGVRIRQLDGSLHTYPRDELVRIEYSDGTVSRRKVPPASPPPETAVPPPPPPPSPVLEKPQDKQPFPLYLTLGAGVSFLGGDAEANVPMQQIFQTQGHVSSEFGLRLSPSFALGVYGDVGGGDVARAIGDQCQMQAIPCIATTGRGGFLIRHTWDPAGSTAKWLTLGTGWEFGTVSVDQQDTGHGMGSDLFSYTGREYLRIGGGLDFRSNAVLGLGLYASFAWGEYDHYKDTTVSVPIQGKTHTTGQVGLRLILFP